MNASKAASAHVTMDGLVTLVQSRCVTPGSVRVASVPIASVCATRGGWVRTALLQRSVQLMVLHPLRGSVLAEMVGRALSAMSRRVLRSALVRESA